jgi:thiamine biosynthesis lipoprotein
MMLTHHFRAMGTSFELILDASPSVHALRAFDHAARLIDDLESRLSRFRPDSELSVLNRTGRAHVSPEVLELTQLALQARRDTDGRFDPTVMRSLVAAGYDRSFDDLPIDTGPVSTDASCNGAVDVDPMTGHVALGDGVGLDLGGIAKGYAAEAACDVLVREGPCLVSAGGDIATRGIPATGTWAVGVETAEGPVTLGIDSGGVATSGCDRRRWRSGGGWAHHLIDPATGRPAETDVLRITVAAESAVRAETLATALFLAGADGAIAEASERGVTAIVTTEERTLMTGDLS